MTPPSAHTEWNDCICTDYDGKAISPCGVPCPVHNKKQYDEGVWHDNMKQLPKSLQRCMTALLLEVDESIVHSITDEIVKAVASERTRLLSVESMKMEDETFIEPCENCGGEGYGRAWTGHGRETGSAFGDRYEPTHSFVFCKECAPQFTIGKDWMGEEIWKRTSDREEHAQIRINSITHVSKEAKARNLLRQSIISEMEK